MDVAPIPIVEATTGMPVMEEMPELALCELNSTRFQEILAREVNQHPEQEDIEGVVRISVTIDADGVLRGMEVIQGLTAAADREAVRALTVVAEDLYFEQNRGEDGVADEHKAVVTVTFGGGKP
jgi:TonB family protein